MTRGQKNNKIILETKNLYKIINGSTILKNINLTVKQGETLALTGESGAGKTTLLQMIGLLDTPSSGQLFINEIDTTLMKDAQKTNLRLHDIGFVYQFHHLIEEMSVRDNILLPAYLSNKTTHILKIIEQLKLDYLLDRDPHTLSGGEKQRVSILRAVTNEPKILLADEPTGNLDSVNANIVIDLFLELTKLYDMTLVIVTHNLDIAKRMNRIVKMKDGEILI